MSPNPTCRTNPPPPVTRTAVSRSASPRRVLTFFVLVLLAPVFLTPNSVSIAIQPLLAAERAEPPNGQEPIDSFELDLGPQGPGQNRRLYGHATLEADAQATTGQYGTWRLSYQVGHLGIDDGARLFLLFNAVADWGRFQWTDPEAPNYVSVETMGQAHISVSQDNRHAGPRPYWGGLIFTVREGNLVAGDRVNIILGDRSAGSPGARAPTVKPHQSQEFRFAVDPLNANMPVRVLESPRMEVLADEAARLQLLWPSEAEAGGTTWLLVKVKDKWGNPATSFTGTVALSANGIGGLPETYTFRTQDRGYRRFDDLALPPEETRITVHGRTLDAPALKAESNLLVTRTTPEFNLYCGDLHGQHIRGSSNLAQYAGYARGFAGIDFMSWAVNDFHITSATWDAIQATSRHFDEAGRFVVFPGYEWSGTTGRGGDHNVIYLEEDQPLFRSAYVEPDLRGYDPADDRYTVTDLIASVDRDKTFLMPHIGGRRANLEYHDANLMPVIEMYSNHGQFEWFLREALERGLKVGFTASSDDVYGKLGDSIPGDGLFSVHGGLTCVFARNLTREAIWEAFLARRVYATTGERIQLRFTAGEHWMGQELTAREAPRFTVETSGTAGIEQIEFFRGTERIGIFRPDRPASDYRVVWRGAASRERGRVTNWSGEIRGPAAKLDDIRPWRLDYPTETVRHDDEAIHIATVTSGDEDGVVFTADATTGAAIDIRLRMRSRGQFDTSSEGDDRVEVTVPLDEITPEATVFQAGGVDREVAVSRVGRDYPGHVRHEWTDPHPPGGTHAYWVRVQQEDGATAWSSPIFVTR
ncbi:DUF3604 domain-containing protein [Elongatibacter sediminis]|uniref:DUF3604 domain-containing protein n=1 Tax=Elongatibacter sediminis TaxID=3119006 RepID=A0AAW9RDX5_9GAMM